MDKCGGGGGSSNTRDGGSPPTSSSSSATAAAATPTTVGCGSSANSTPSMTLNVTTTTGGNFSVAVDGENSVENLKKIISKKLKVSKDRICLLHRERELHDGSLRDNGLMDGSKLILTPNVETGLLAQRAENTVMQALESLNDNQVNDFLSGKSPLNLSVRLGDHMMLIQLQLSTLNPSSQNGSRSKTHKSRTPGQVSATGTGSNIVQATSSSRGHSRTTIPIGCRRITTIESPLPSNTKNVVEQLSETQTLTKQEIEDIHSIVKNLAESDSPAIATVSPRIQEPMETELEPRVPSVESPIKSLSNLVSSSINSNVPSVPCNNNTILSGPPSPCPDPISANLTSCLCKSLDGNDNSSCESNCHSRIPEPQQPSTSSAVLHKTAHNPITRHKMRIQTIRKHSSFESPNLVKPESETLPSVESKSAPSSPHRIEQAHLLHSHLHHHHYYHHHHHHHHTPNPVQSIKTSSIQPGPVASQPSRTLGTDPNNTENPALAEASRNLTQTLRKLSKRVFTNKVNDMSQETARNVSSGAVIESMKHHGKGIYSGTFSGTLNPALQDKFGRPKRDISTIIHILNDLLSAAPQCARSGTKIYFEPSTPLSSAQPSQGSATPTTAASSSCTTTTSSTRNTAVAGNNNIPASGTSSISPTIERTTSVLTSPIAAPRPRLITRCTPTPIQIKKYPSSGTITSSSTNHTQSNNASSNCYNCCKAVLDTNAVASTRNVNTFVYCQHHQKSIVPNMICKCGLPVTSMNTANSNSTKSSLQCQRCATISAAELENSKTKTKLDNLRLIMQQKKERREARKQKCSPYGGSSSPSSAKHPLIATTTTAKQTPTTFVGLCETLSEAVQANLQQLQQKMIKSTSNTSIGEKITETTAEEESQPIAAVTSNTTQTVASKTPTETNTNSISCDDNNSNGQSTSNATTTTATATTTASTAAGPSSSEASTPSHQIVEEVDTVA